MGYAPRALVATPPSPALTGDTLVVQEDYGPVFAGRIPFTALIWPQDETPVEGINAEYAQVIAISGDQLQLIRGPQPIAVEAGMQVAAMDVIPKYERGTPIELVGHFLDHDPPYRVHVRAPDGSAGVFDADSDDGLGNAFHSLDTRDLSGLWAFRWESASGHLEDNSLYVDYSDALP